MLYSSIAPEDLPGETAEGFQQHNQPNRLLLVARRAQAQGFLEEFLEGFLDYRNTEHLETDYAQRVLIRLKNFRKENSHAED